MRPIDKVKLVLMTLVISFTLLCSIVQVEGPRLPAATQTHTFSQASDSDDGIIKFVASHQNHLLRLEQSQRNDTQPRTLVYELVHSWSAEAILLLLLGWLTPVILLYHRQSFQDFFGAIHRHRLQRQHLQYRFSQSYLTA
ncbi:hypothetical protein [Aeromonas enteropelogenes]|uniref:hypothetical protein n=1 Tax=Aeromonas enteropelogenes TaxID=29489 RepID=UPI000F51C492|nr:hypothetical protein [Aeromonas enteropelogenes]RQM70151.1 hypothetical protein EHZ64_01705 [Aeromonas enteropelogenes]